MHLSALVDLGVPPDWLQDQLNKLTLSGEYNIELSAEKKMGIAGTKARVHAKDQHDHRHHSTIVSLLQKANLEPGVERRALAMFHAIAVAEAKIHDIDIEAVHFHEVGAIDSIIDITAAAIAIEYFQPDHILCSAVEVGSGYVDCAHGRFPVPAPATQELLSGIPCTYGTVTGESTTPTGAAIVAVNVTEFLPKGAFSPEKIGYGIGHKDFEIPNVFRVALGEYQPITTGTSSATEKHVKIEANIDDMTPEAFEPLAEALFQAGAVDIYFTPIVMKKGRPAQMVSALCAEHLQSKVSAALLNHSSTIGLRTFPFDKTVLEREALTLTTTLGEVRVKRVVQPNGQTRWKSEHDDVQALALKAGIDYPSAKRLIDFEIGTQID
jgi:uncharacterized protein (TIGR00299 family) protein